MCYLGLSIRRANTILYIETLLTWVLRRAEAWVNARHINSQPVLLHALL